MLLSTRWQVGSLVLSGLLLAGCPSEDAGDDGAKGTLGGGMIGPEGGTISSSDQRLTLKIPAGALTAATAIKVESTTEQAPGQVGPAFKISPANVHFDKPAQLALKLDAAKSQGVSQEQLHVAAKSGEEWLWYPARPDVEDAQAEISDTGTYSLVPGAQLVPGQGKAKVGSTLSFDIVRCTADKPDNEELMLGYRCEKGGLSATFAKDWSVNSVPGGSATFGTITPSGSGTSSNASAVFTAPAKKPAQNPVAVSVVTELADLDDPTLTSTLVAHVEIVEDEEQPQKPSQSLADVKVWEMTYTVESNCDHSWAEYGVSYERKEKYTEEGKVRLTRGDLLAGATEWHLTGTGTAQSSMDKTTVKSSQYYNLSRYDRGNGPTEVIVSILIDLKQGAYDVYFQHGDFVAQYGGVDSYAGKEPNMYGPSEENINIISAPIKADGTLTRRLPTQGLTIADNYDWAQYWVERQQLEPDLDLEDKLRKTGGCSSGKTSWVIKPVQ